MIVHVPMAVHPNVRRVLVIGGGDGGVARELSYYDEIEAIDVVEPDKMFVDVCREVFPRQCEGTGRPARHRILSGRAALPARQAGRLRSDYQRLD